MRVSGGTEHRDYSVGCEQHTERGTFQPPRNASLFLLFSVVIMKKNRAVARTLPTQVMLHDVAGVMRRRLGPTFSVTLKKSP